MLDVFIIQPDAGVRSAATDLACILCPINPVILPRQIQCPRSQRVYRITTQNKSGPFTIAFPQDGVGAQLGFSRFSTTSV